MNREEQEVALRWAFREAHATPLFHAHVETRIEGLDFNDILQTGASSEVLEEEERPQGLTKVLLAFVTEDDPIHIVVNVEAFEKDFTEPIRVVTVYRPEPPKWRDERTRGVR